MKAAIESQVRVHCDVTGTQGSGIPAGIGADSGKFRLWTGIPGIRDCRRGVPLGRYGCSHGYSGPKSVGEWPAGPGCLVAGRQLVGRLDTIK